MRRVLNRERARRALSAADEETLQSGLRELGILGKRSDFSQIEEMLVSGGLSEGTRTLTKKVIAQIEDSRQDSERGGELVG
tara:strand:+ start:79 stop:321 length:243 start_codon:yes stop_codon:yes gene_type:complete